MGILKTIRDEIQEIKELKVNLEGQEKKISQLEKEVKTLKETVVVQQKFWEEIDNEKRCKNLIFLGIKEDEAADED